MERLIFADSGCGFFWRIARSVLLCLGLRRKRAITDKNERLASEKVPHPGPLPGRREFGLAGWPARTLTSNRARKVVA